MQRIFRIDLPWPPSVNHYWKLTRGGGRALTDEAKVFRERVYAEVIRRHGTIPKPVILNGDLSCTLLLKPPSRRKSDIDNRDKAIFDALEKASVYENDNQIRHRETFFGEIVEGGMVRVILREAEHNPKLSEYIFANL